jgi:potassium efflux system protein
VTSLGAFLRTAMLAVLLCLVNGLAAQQITDEQRAYHEKWLATAQRAESVLSVKRASNAALEQLRAEIVQFRDTFNRSRSADDDRIATLQSQLDALGPAPEEGKTEAPDIAELRERLNQQLDRLRVPKIISEEAYSRANGLINEIDATIWEHTRKELLSRGPSPLNLALWPEAYRHAFLAMQSLYHETVDNLKSEAVEAQIRNRAPAIIVMMLLGLLLFVRGRRWSDRIGGYLRSLGGAGSGVWSFVVSFTRILFPWIGVVFIVTAISLTGIPGLRGTLFLERIPYLAGLFLYIDWIRRQLVTQAIAEDLDSHLANKAAQYRIYVGLLALSLVLHDLIGLYERIETPTPETLAVISFPIILVTGLVLFRMMSLSRSSGDETEDHSDGRHLTGFLSLFELVRRVVFLLGTVSPVLAALGYSVAAEAIIFPAVGTLVLISTLLLLYRFAANVYGWLSGKGAAASDSLFVVVVGFILALVSLPVLALIWGARAAELVEIWSTLMSGVEFGGITISPTIFIVFAAVFTFGYTLTRLLQGGLRNSLLPKTRMDPGGQNAVVAGIGYIGIILTALIAIISAGIDLTALGYVAGALSVGIGFGLQNIVSNFVSGIILLIERPISKDDWINVNGQMGYVRDISVRSTRIETFDRTDVIVPNSDLISGTVTNYTRGNTVGRVIVPVGVAYGTDTKKVEKILLEVANAHPMVLAYPAPNVVFQGFGADSLDFEIRAILRDVNWVLSVKSDMNHEIARRFAEEDIEIPFAQRDIWLRNPEVLRGASRVEPPAQSAESRLNTPVEMTEGDVEETDVDRDHA